MTNNNVDSLKEFDLDQQDWKIANNSNHFSLRDVFEHAKRDRKCTISVGTDSQVIGKTFRFISVLCIYNPGKGGFYYYLQKYCDRDNYRLHNQKMRMFDEVAKSIELAVLLRDETGVLPEVHIDASPEKYEEFTSSFSEQLKGYVLGMGFTPVLKPESFAASTIADKHTKKLSKKKQRKLRRKNK